ncbi:integrin beta-1-binding protein 1-like [Mizuhopecten yessoensis]|uniref:Integrin beta-1-binding protein 1 n=1 Tax=Mizuhopecten yessoensis TaxID=6573 RepID=A0A210Q7P9_MIZYE|nr:integrin beta-1-binding protein 1-like [Mizuhopecten yessoensis]OWF44751.1 Integrin beta-1-binding protein 1 [Mizuhopecten yessoensis]
MFRGKGKSKSSQHSESGRESGKLGGSSPEIILDGLNQETNFEVFFLGAVQDINMVTSRKRDKEAQLVDQVEEAQIDGKLPLTPRDEDKVNITISRHGLKVLDSTKKEVLQRHPLHIIAQVVHYEDGFGKPNVAFKIGQLQHSKDTCIYQCYVFQCPNEDQAQAVCQSLRNIFNAITVQ